MRGTRLWTRALGIEKASVVEVYLDEEDSLVVQVRVHRRERHRCPHCGRRSGRYDGGDGYRYWRALDVGTIKVYVESLAPRVQCRIHGVVVARVPWARHGARSTRDFDDHVAWLVTHTDKSSVCHLMRISWRTAGRIVDRVGGEGRRRRPLLAGLRRIGIDEVSYRKHHKYIVVVVDHETNRLVWAAPGRNSATVAAFFEELGPERCADIELVSADAASWISGPVQQHCPNAVLCMDPFHVVQWATNALDEVRRDVWRQLRRDGESAAALSMKRSRYVLRKARDKLTSDQQSKLASIQRTNRPLFRAYLLKEQLRGVFQAAGDAAIQQLDDWIAWAQRSRLKPFVRLGRSIKNHRAAIDAALRTGLTNARTESMNTKIRLLTRLAYGFHSAGALIGLAMLKLGGLCPELPGRAPALMAAK